MQFRARCITLLFLLLRCCVHAFHGSHGTTAILFHKPTGCVTTHVDNQDLPVQKLARLTVFDHLPEHITGKNGPKWHAVGRLDLKTSGLLIMTNDGRLVHHATSPSTKLPKKYRALCMGHLLADDLERLRCGVDLAGGLGFSSPCAVQLEGYEGRSKTRLSITIQEGKNRQVRRMLHSIQSGVIELERVEIGGLTLEGIEEPGDWRYLSTEELTQKLGYDPSAQPFHSGAEHKRWRGEGGRNGRAHRNSNKRRRTCLQMLLAVLLL
mmetsp:Transcript_58683/g.107036  ORF Transcript_58683/g.107036 Transcript_58683/m.107036 type:complete len:266 (-) Transcript_58683:91-888(-)